MEIFVGVLGKACQRYGIRLHAVVVLSNHYHLLATVPSTGALSWAMRYFAGNLSKEVGRLYRWQGRLWATRFHCSLVDDCEATQVSRLLYLLAAGCKEGLVEKPADWPGVHCAEALAQGLPLRGVWISRRSQWAARNRKAADASDGAHSEEIRIELEPLPCWAHLPEAVWRARVAELLAEIEEATRKRHQEARTRPLGVAKILRVHPHHRPDKVAWSPQPLIFARDPCRHQDLWCALRSVAANFWIASERLARGDPHPSFPEGTFPPGLPYVPTATDLLRGT